MPEPIISNPKIRLALTDSAKLYDSFDTKELGSLYNYIRENAGTDTVPDAIRRLPDADLLVVTLMALSTLSIVLDQRSQKGHGRFRGKHEAT